MILLYLLPFMDKSEKSLAKRPIHQILRVSADVITKHI